MIVMIVCHYDNTNPLGGLEKQARLLAARMRNDGQPVVILSSTRTLARAKWFDDKGVPVRLFWTYASPQVAGRYMPAGLIWAAQLLLWIALNHRRIDIIHCHQIRIHAFIAAIARKVLGIPVVAKSALGGPGADLKVISSRKYFGPWGRKFLLRNIDYFVATTPSIENDLIFWQVPKAKVGLIPNGIEISDATPAPHTEERAQRCVFLGRLDRDKNILALAQAAIETTRSSKLSLDIFGDGPELPKLRSLLERESNHRVRLMSWHPNPMEFLQEYGYLLLPSEAEGLSNAMIEAMASGVVPVTSRVSGCVDHIRNGVNGLFFEGSAIAELQAGLTRLTAITTENWAQISAAARSYALDHFDIAQVARAYGDLYRRLSGRRIRPS